MRGVHDCLACTSCAVIGSSPHARGPRQAVAEAITTAGIIPACAGSTRSQAGVGHGKQDHPRMRGVHVSGAVFSCTGVGSSPHARGPL